MRGLCAVYPPVRGSVRAGQLCGCDCFPDGGARASARATTCGQFLSALTRIPRAKPASLGYFQRTKKPRRSANCGGAEHRTGGPALCLTPENGRSFPCWQEETVNTLSREKRIAVLAALVEANSERAVERMCQVNRKTVSRLALEFGLGAQRLHDSMAFGLSCEEIEADECWAYVFCKEARVRPDHPVGAGEAYVFCGIDKASRYAITWHIGKRDQKNTDVFVADLRTRLRTMPTIVTDGFAPYVSAVGAEFSPAVGMVQTVKNYSARGRRDDDHRYEPPRMGPNGFVTKKVVYGSPDVASASTAYVERLNASMRHRIGRMRRLVYAFSKRLPNLVASCALNYCWTNLGCVLRTTRTTPAMAVGVTTHLWSMEEFYDAITAAAAGAPVEKPVKQPLTHKAPPGVARQTSSGGWLRLLPGGAPTGPGLAPAPGPRPAAPAAAPPVLREAPRPMVQLDLFGPSPEGGNPERGQ